MSRVLRRRLGRYFRIAALSLIPSLAPAAGPDSWVLALSWSPEYCHSRPGSEEPQCLREHFFTLAGLRPLIRGSKPESCGAGRPERPLLDRLMRHIPNKSTATRLWHESAGCSGLEADAYLIQLDRAGRRIQIPKVYSAPQDQLNTDGVALRAAFIAENPGLTDSALTLECKGSWLTQVQVCVDQDFAFQACGIEFNDRCKGKVKIRAIRRDRLGRGTE